MRYLGLDWGERKVGVALSDPLGITAQPLPYVENNDRLLPTLNDLAQKNSVKEIVVGLPRNMNGTEGASADKVKALRDRLKKDLDMNVVLWDERLTTKMAERTLIDSGVSRSRRKSVVDSMSACFMLQSYMDSRKK